MISCSPQTRFQQTSGIQQNRTFPKTYCKNRRAFQVGRFSIVKSDTHSVCCQCLQSVSSIPEGICSSLPKEIPSFLESSEEQVVGPFHPSDVRVSEVCSIANPTVLFLKFFITPKMFKISFITQALVVFASLVVLLEAVNLKYNYDVRYPPVFGTYSKLGSLRDRESLSSLNGARVAVFRRQYNQPTQIVVPVPVYKKAYIPNKPPTYVEKPVSRPVRNPYPGGVQGRSGGGLLDGVGDIAGVADVGNVAGLLGGGGGGGLLGLGGLLGSLLGGIGLG